MLKKGHALALAVTTAGLIGFGAPLGLLPPSESFGCAALAVAALFAVGGLASSAFHLGRPAPAWRHPDIAERARA